MGAQTSVEIDTHKEVSFTVHGKQHIISVSANNNITPRTSLNEYLRDYAELRDTKNMCREGGCGACIVAITVEHPVLRRKKTIAVNSCLIPVLACHNYDINTVHGIGNRQIGYNSLQTALAKFKGTQCGYCSGGMIMNMYALFEDNDVLTMSEIENSFGGNICRCTGYRPILDAFKSLASDADPGLVRKYPDIEDIKLCSKTGKVCNSVCKSDDFKPILIEFDEKMYWYKVYTIHDILTLFHKIGVSTYRFVAGNTGQGVYKITNPPENWIDIQSVTELISYKLTTNLTLGGNMSLTDTMTIMNRLGDENYNYRYLKKIAKHIDRVANVPVRNVGTLAGNLSLKHDHHEFPSDIFLLLETVNARLTIVQENGNEIQMSPADYINFPMNKCILKCITLNTINKDTHFFESYKICPRYQNAHAYVNAGFLVKYDSNYVVTKAHIVYGGINPDFVHAKNTEEYLKGKNLFDNATIQGALETLSNEVKPTNTPPDASPAFRKNLARNLLYKFILASAPQSKINPRHQSGGTNLERNLSSGSQLYQTDKQMYPVTEPVQKLEGLIQSSGEAKYIDDMPSIPGEVFAAFVLADAAPLSKIVHVDTTEAMKMPGVIKYVDYKDIPGENYFTTSYLLPTLEQLFCEEKVLYNGQPVGLIIAHSERQAYDAVMKVKIIYEPTDKVPDYTIQDVLDHKNDSKINFLVQQNATRKGTNTKHVLNGKWNLLGQYHFTMETQRCICIPTDDGGYDLHSGTQFITLVQHAAAQALKLPINKINVIVKRVGGAYGAKIVRAAMVSTACAIAAHVMNKPVRLLLPLTTNMTAIGKRMPTLTTYEVGTDEDGIIQYLDTTFYQACGTSGENEQKINDMQILITNAYAFDTWTFKGGLVSTDTAGNGYCRAPGATEAIGIIETVMDNISVALNKDPVEIRRNNLLNNNNSASDFIDDIINWSNYSQKLKNVTDYNNKNRWKKRGLGFALMNYHFTILLFPYSILITIYSGDGTVAISHGGIEVGQGINTKVAQVCAYMLNIPMNMIRILASDNVMNPNNSPTGASITSEAVCYATMHACKELLKRLEPTRQKMKNPTWTDLIRQAQTDEVELTATAQFTSTSEKNYDILGACVCQVHVDMLTGEHVIESVDLLEDVGRSISPSIDVGQLEGAFIMGMGNYLMENLIYGDHGEILTNNTWTYKVPGAKDIPVDFRIKFKQNSSNPDGVLNSKATGEPATALAIAVPFAIRRALLSARKEAGITSNQYIPIDGVTTVEFTLDNADTDYKTFTL